MDELRGRLTGPLAKYRDLPFPTRISDAITLSTFHGCPAHEIEGIVAYLLTEVGVDVCIKLNPTLLGRPAVEHLLHDVMGYHDVQTSPEAFDKDLQLVDALAMIPRLQLVARDRGRHLAVKCSNTLVVKNHRTFFKDEVMYLSGPPLHVITMNLVRTLRESLGAAIPISFSAGLDAHNVSNAVAMNLVPTTTCTDLLRPGGYGRLPRYVAALEARMRELGVARVPDLILRHAGQAPAAVRQVVAACDAATAAAAGEQDGGAIERARRWMHEHLRAAPGGLGRGRRRARGRWTRCAPAWPTTSSAASATPFRPPSRRRAARASPRSSTPWWARPARSTRSVVVEQTTTDPRYGWEKNKGVPRKIGSKLWLYDCVNCDKCVPVCPNDANFVYEGAAMAVTFDDVEIDAKGRWRALPGDEEFVDRQGASARQLRRLLQRLRQLRRLLPRGRGPAGPEAALLREPRDLPPGRRRERLLPRGRRRAPHHPRHH